jgi:tRNA-dihydrouridine synthase B
MKFDEIFFNSNGEIQPRAVFLAPMAGVTDAPFRELVRSFGATAVVSEMVSSEALVRNSKKTYRRLANKNDDTLKIMQIVGYDPVHMAESAVINEDFGTDVIDINMGCPVKKIVCNNSGSALMRNEDLAVKITESVVKAVKVPVTVKMRLGWDADHINFSNLARKFEGVGVRMLAIHCRTRNQMYSGTADWSKLKELKEKIKIPYLCNGDIKSSETAVGALQQSNANGIMIGRAALGKPWLLRQIMNCLQDGEITDEHSRHFCPTLEEQFKIIMQHFQSTIDFYGENRGIRMFRKHFCWYSSGLDESSFFREVINTSDDLSFIKKYVKSFYEKRFLEQINKNK